MTEKVKAFFNNSSIMSVKLPFRPMDEYFYRKAAKRVEGQA